MKRKPAKPKKPKNPNPPPQKIIRYEDYREMLKGRYIPEGWEK